MHAILAVGITKVCPPALTRMPLNVASVIGSTMRKVVPAPRAVSMVICPPSFSTFSRTIAMPRPRPEISVRIALVEIPDSKMSASAACSLSVAVSSAASVPARMAEAFTFSTSMPAPSSATVISTLLPSSCDTASVSVPHEDLCAAARAAGFSMP